MDQGLSPLSTTAQWTGRGEECILPIQLAQFGGKKADFRFTLNSGTTPVTS